jgi:nucleoside-triphosphatase THEP1
MIKIITGEKNSGKSTKFLRLYRETNPSAVGLFSEKLVDSAGSIIGYDLILLPTEERFPFILLKESINPDDADDYYLQGRFAFLKEAFSIAEKYILEFPANSPVWIDEIGNLELKGLGYDALLQSLMKSNSDLTFTVRDHLLEKIVSKYGIREYELL